MLFTLMLIVGFFHKSITVPRNCTPEDFCRPVPASVCDNSLCQPVTTEELNAFGNAGLKAYTWTIAQKPFNEYCPLIFDFQKSVTYDNRIAETITYTVNTGPYCNISYPTTKIFYPDEIDPYTGKVKVFKLEQAGQLYDACIPYNDPGFAYIYRTCRVDPPPPPGEGCASIYVEEFADKCNTNRDKLVKFVQSLGIEFLQESVDCL